MYSPVWREYYDSSDFFNFGYWETGTRTQKEAGENLMERLLAFIPSKRGTILDLARGKGETTRYLLHCYCPRDVTGINISYRQLEGCRQNSPRCTFVPMDATSMTFEEDSFDNIIYVEAAFHFDTRETFCVKPCGSSSPADDWYCPIC